jgi:putative ABC transport system permease protein
VNHFNVWQEWAIVRSLLLKFTLRHWIAAKWNYCLILLIVAVGVGSLNGIRQASRAATANFGLFNEAVSGRSDFLIQAPAGPMDSDHLFKLSKLSHSSDWHLFPVVEGTLQQLNSDGAVQRQLRLVGLDLLSVSNLPRFIEQGFTIGDRDANWYDWLKRDNAIWVSPGFLEATGLDVGDGCRVSVAGKVQTLQIAGALSGKETPIPDDLIIADLPVVQTLLARSGEVDRVEVILDDRGRARDPEATAIIEDKLRKWLPEGFVLKPAAERVAERASMTEAFRLNLVILSLISMMVSAYLILQALDAAVVRRRGEIATLKSLGVSSRSIRVTLLLEAVFIGLFGSALGIGLGALLATATVQVLADTVNALYFATSVKSIQLQASDLWVGFGMGIVLSLFAGWLPARDAMQTPPAQILARGDWSPGFRLLQSRWPAVLMVLLGLLALKVPAPVLESGGRIPVGGFVAAGCWIFAAALLSGECMVALNKGLLRFNLGPVSRLAVSRVAEGSSRHRLAVAGLVVAVAMVTGILQLVGSFQGTIERWLDVRFQADLYVSEQGSTGADSLNGIDPEVVARLVSRKAVDYADTQYVTYVNAPRGRTMLSGVDLELWKNRIDQIWQIPPGTLDPVEGAEPALVSEAFARRFGVLQGGVVTLETPAGPKAITPIGIYADYGNEFGTATINQNTWRQWVGTDRPLNTSLFLKSGVDTNVVRDALRLEFPGLDIRNARELREVVLTIFHETFRVTFALNIIGTAVAIAGLVLGMLAIFAESTSTWETLSHLGFRSRSFILMAGLESASIALSSWLSGTVVGLALGWLLIYVINVQSFGWTLLWELPFFGILLFGMGLVACGFLCGLFTASNFKRRTLNFER